MITVLKSDNSDNSTANLRPSFSEPEDMLAQKMMTGSSI